MPTRLFITHQILDPQVIEDPYPFFKALLAEAPVYRVPGTPVYLVSSWDLIHQVLRNQDDYSAHLTGILMTSDDGKPALFDLAAFGGTIDAIANADEPFHSVHRRLVTPFFTARRVDALENEVREWARSGVQALVDASGGDCVTDLANAIPVKVTARLLGLPINDVDKLLDWAFSGGEILSGTATLKDLAEAGDATSRMRAYLSAHFGAALASAPAAEPGNLLEALAVGVFENQISEDDAIGILVVMVGAAAESTSSLVGSAIRLLAQDLVLQGRLRRAPQLLEPFIEEVVRLESPFKGHYREVIQDTDLGGVKLSEKSRVFLLWAAANRDPEVFNQPDELDISRGNLKEHLGFGHGIHFCVGARVARMELRVILEALLTQTSEFTISADHTVHHLSSIFVRRLPQLHLAVRSA
ncbi:MAG: cytochrome P450 [Halioglobus sp.]